MHEVTFPMRLHRVVAHARGEDRPGMDWLRRLGEVPATAMGALTELLAEQLPGRFSLTGTLDRRLLLAERDRSLGGWTFADLSGHEHWTRSWPAWTDRQLTVLEPRTWLGAGLVSEHGAYRMQRPRVLLTALYHPEWFPLPRFPLGISDLARACRATLMGQVRLMDMQLGATLADIEAQVATWAPDIVGISVTFGQHDLLVELLDGLFTRPAPPLVVAGGSLSARNETLLLERHPQLLVARGAGEPTISDLVGHFHGDVELASVRGLGYRGAARGGGLPFERRHTATVANRDQLDIWPELDLLDDTFACQGVAQLELSRGCVSSCSFCPRSHKGTWAGADASRLSWLLAAMGEVFDRHPQVSRTLYLVDEEFLGRGDTTMPRALELAEALHEAGFGWESSCRVDQVTDPTRDRDWHLERVGLWRRLPQLGLGRMLFGVESGVDSVLLRFNKEVTAAQNVLAVRTLTALGVPTRFTYITFDPLMDLAELQATVAFQARTDLLLRPAPHLSAQQIVDGVHDVQFVAEHSTGRPFYTGISYMLVSMECLIGSEYTRSAHSAGLIGDPRPSLGRVDTAFADWRVGRCSHHGQMWIDRHFALDYTMKSLEKVLEEPTRQAVRQARVVIKDAAFAVLTRWLAVIAGFAADTPGRDRLDRALLTVMDSELEGLVDRVDDVVAAILPDLPDHLAAVLRHEHNRWRAPQQWRMINAADTCGSS